MTTSEAIPEPQYSVDETIATNPARRDLVEAVGDNIMEQPHTMIQALKDISTREDMLGLSVPALTMAALRDPAATCLLALRNLFAPEGSIYRALTFDEATTAEINAATEAAQGEGVTLEEGDVSLLGIKIASTRRYQWGKAQGWDGQSVLILE